MVFGTWVAASQDFAPVWELPILSVTAYTALAALALNLVVAGVLTVVLGDRARTDELDETRAEEYDELEETREPAPAVGAGLG
jgi:hypothetical protein